ncbi:MAG: hypothetical protein H7A24_01800 [Leptospiraceae bacterium]|nr:hypothetical protein [Leptospiraceae bacterium]MCP5510583.1 hypothetical protein [Leptospiraceae bacterium]
MSSKNYQKLTEKIPRILFVFSYFSAFYLFFSLQKLSDTLFFQIKTHFFSEIYPLGALGVLLVLTLLSGKNLKTILFTAVLLLSPLIFFLFFGIEKFTYWNWEFFGFSLLKSQNPLIFIPLMVIFIIPDWKIQLGIFVFFFFVLFGVITSDKSFLSEKPEKVIYSKYIPPEFFWEGSSLLVEEDLGVYQHFRKKPIEEPILKFTMKPLRKLSLQERIKVQKWVSQFEFPIVLKDEEKITVFDVFRSYQGVVFQIEYNYKTGDTVIKGPIF